MEEFFKNKKILITGHSGFKGSWLSQILINLGADLVGVSLAPNTKPSLFEILGLEDVVKNYFVDIRSLEKIKNIFQDEKPEIVFHLAAQPIVRDSYDDPMKTHTTNIIGTANVLQAIKEINVVKAAVIITTDKVYENKEWVYPYREVDSLGGHDPYSASKAAADIVSNSYIQSFFNIIDYGEKHHTLVAVARAGNVIGGGDWANHRLVPDIVRSVYKEKKEVIIRSPRAIRPWEHVLEPISGYLKLAQGLYNGNLNFSGAWNFGPNDESFVCVEKLASEALEFLKGGKFKIKKDESKHEANLLKLDISKAKNILNWHPVLNFEESIKFTFEWYKKYYEKPKNIVQFTNNQIKLFFNKSRG